MVVLSLSLCPYIKSCVHLQVTSAGSSSLSPARDERWWENDGDSQPAVRTLLPSHLRIASFFFLLFFSPSLSLYHKPNCIFTGNFFIYREVFLFYFNVFFLTGYLIYPFFLIASVIEIWKAKRCNVQLILLKSCIRVSIVRTFFPNVAAPP